MWAKQGRSFTNDELFVFVVAEEMCPENINLVKLLASQQKQLLEELRTLGVTSVVN